MKNDNLKPRIRASTAMEEAIRSAIASGELRPGDCLPSEPSLRDRFGISVTSVRRGIAALMDEGLVERRHGSGTYVARAHKAPSPVRRHDARNTVVLALPMALRMYHPYFSEQQAALRDELARAGWSVRSLLEDATDGAAHTPDELSLIPYDPEALARRIAAFDDVAGAVVGATLANAMPAEVRARLPLVALNPTPACPFVAYRWRDEVEAVVARMVGNGCRHIWAYDLPVPMAEFAAMAVTRAGVVEGEEAAHGLLSEMAAAAFEATRRRMAAHPETDGILVGSDYAAQGVLDALSRAGGVTGGAAGRWPVFAMVNETSAIDTTYPYSRLVADGAAAGRMLAKLLMRRITRPGDAVREVWLRARLEIA